MNNFIIFAIGFIFGGFVTFLIMYKMFIERENREIESYRNEQT